MDHNYKIITDDNGYINGFCVSNDDYDFTGQMSQYPDVCKGWTKLINGQLIEDEEKKQDIIESIAKSTEIESLKKSLSDTDYIMAEAFENVFALNNPVTFIADFIKILIQFNTKYASLIANRKVWRDRIEELSK